MQEQEARLPLATEQSSLPVSVGDYTQVDELTTVLNELPIGYQEVDRQGIVRRVNRASCEMLGYRAEDLLGRPYWEWLAKDEISKSRAHFEATIRGELPLHTTRRAFRTASGEYRVVEIHRTLMHDAHGNILGLRIATIDVTQQDMAEEHAREVRNRLENVMSSIPEAVLVTDALGFIRYVNSSAESMTGWRASDLVGKQVEKCIPFLAISHTENIPLSFRMVLRGRWHGTATILNAQREQIGIELSASPVVDTNTGFAEGVVTVMRLRTLAAESPSATLQ